MTSFQRQVIVPLQQVGHQLKRYVLIEGLSRCAAILVAMAAVQLFLDRMLVMGLGPRMAMLAVLLGVGGYQFYGRVIRPALLRVDVNDLAAILERRDGALGDELVSAVAFATGGPRNPLRDSPAMVEAMIAEASSRFDHLSTRKILRRDRYLRYSGLGLVALAVAVGAFTLAPETMAAYVARDLLLGEAAWPVGTRIVLEGFRNGRLRWPIGDDLTLVARAEQVVPSALRAEFEYASGERVIRDMDRRGEDHFVLDFGPLAAAMQVRCLIRRFGVDQRTEWSSIEAVHRPVVERVRIEVTPPKYARREPFVLPPGQASADIIRGSRVRIDATMSQPVVQAALVTMDARRPASEARIEEGGTTVWAEFVPLRRGTFFFDVRDEAGLDDRRPVTYTFDLIPDPPPKVRLSLPGAGGLVVSNAILELEIQSEDNLGLKSVELLRRSRQAGGASGGKATAQNTVVPWTAEPLSGFVAGQLRYELKRPWSLLPLSLSPGDQLTLQVRAVDHQPPPPPSPTKPAPQDEQPAVDVDQESGVGVGVSLAYTLRVVTAEEFLVELGRREHEWRREFEQIIKAQEQIHRRIIDLNDRPASEGGSSQRSASYGSEARTQRQQGPRCKTVARQFEQILSELKVNQLAPPTVRRRLGVGVLRSLRQLINTDLGA
ncbi:MAG: hypothetical protein O6758_04905, partial [Planctomycetota bacterium]|nr:hypothetical protein [Planctomycetota bacterium]